MRNLLVFVFLLLITNSVFAQSNDELSPPECSADTEDYLPPRLIPGEQARVVFDVELNLRPAPSVNTARIGILNGGTNLSVIAGPVCTEDFLWWEVSSGDLDGWVAEGSLEDDEYFVEPRGELLLIEDESGQIERYILTANDFLEPEGCSRPPDDYEQVKLDFASLNRRTLFMLDNAQIIYNANGGEWANFRSLITQGSYNPGRVSASFGTHDGGGAIDISVIDTQNGWIIMRDEVLPVLRALRIAGFAAWLRDTDELYDGSVIHIHAIAIGDLEASEIAQQQLSSEFGYFSGYNGLPPAEGADPVPDIYGDPILCEWMIEAGFEDLRN